MGMFVNNVRDIRKRRVICSNKRSGFTCRRFVFKCVSTRNVLGTLYLCHGWNRCGEGEVQCCKE